jgi:hypothetical protein
MAEGQARSSESDAGRYLYLLDSLGLAKMKQAIIFMEKTKFMLT